MNVYQKLAIVQKNLNAPKGQYNKFGNYNYRSCEDIIEAVKPLCIENGLTLTISDQIKQVGERYYVEATATIYDAEGNKHSATASAREPNNKKGMDESQITGAASSYARKYALNGLFAIDDNKDADTNENHKETASKKTTYEMEQEQAFKKKRANQVADLVALAQQKDIPMEKVHESFKKRGVTVETADDATFNGIAKALEKA